MKLLLSLLLVLPALSFAQSDIDERLQSYITKFQLKPLSKPVNTNLELAKLGNTLFVSTLLSGNNNISCVQCHLPANMTIDGLPFAIGEGAHGVQTAETTRMQGSGRIGPRNTPALFNLDGVNVLFWDGRVSFDPTTKSFQTPVAELNGPNPKRSDITQALGNAVAAQAIFPIVDHDEMLGRPGSNPIANAKGKLAQWDLVVKKLLANDQIAESFSKVFPGEKINIGHVGAALAEFQRVAFNYSDTPYDSYIKGDVLALTEIQKIGMDVFFDKGKCGECHNGEHLSNFEFHSVGVPQIGPGKVDGDDFGRFEWDPKPENKYAFRVPPLRNVAMTAPYMHDGAFKTLPQIVEHYDIVEDSIRDYKLVNNWKNYIDKLTDVNHEQDDIRIEAISKKMSHHLRFEEQEEKALSEFLSTALTDKLFLNREVGGDYSTYFRLQLKESGFNKLAANFKGDNHRDVYYYFDALLEGGFFLRGLSSPIRLIVVKKPHETQLIYREQVYKTATAQNNVVLEGNFNRQNLVTLDSAAFDPIEEAYLDMFNRLYTYNDGNKQEELPATELSIIKEDLNIMNAGFRNLPFDGMANITDQMNRKKEDIVFVPTSYNIKDVMIFNFDIAGKKVEGNLQKSFIRTETGAIEVTYALELETSKVSKAQYGAFAKEILKNLNLEADEVGGGSPSPSNLTLKVLNQVL